MNGLAIMRNGQVIMATGLLMGFLVLLVVFVDFFVALTDFFAVVAGTTGSSFGFGDFLFGSLALILVTFAMVSFLYKK